MKLINFNLPIYVVKSDVLICNSNFFYYVLSAALP